MVTRDNGDEVFLPNTGGVLGKLRDLFPASEREGFYRGVSAFIILLFAFGVLDENEAALWTQLAVSAVTCLFALLHATSTWRAALYLIVGPLGAVLMGYGIVTDSRWALIAAAAGQALGITTAAAKTVQEPTG